MSEISVRLKYMLRINIRTKLTVIYDTKNIIGGLFSLSKQYIEQLLTVLSQILKKTSVLTCRCSMCIENESTCKYLCSHAPYTRFTSVLRFCRRSDGLTWLRKNIPSCTVSYTALPMKTDLHFQPTLSKLQFPTDFNSTLLCFSENASKLCCIDITFSKMCRTVKRRLST